MCEQPSKEEPRIEMTLKAVGRVRSRIKIRSRYGQESPLGSTRNGVDWECPGWVGR
jgi:hypothetical protein